MFFFTTSTLYFPCCVLLFFFFPHKPFVTKLGNTTNQKTNPASEFVPIKTKNQSLRLCFFSNVVILVFYPTHSTRSSSIYSNTHVYVFTITIVPCFVFLVLSNRFASLPTQSLQYLPSTPIRLMFLRMQLLHKTRLCTI